MKFFCSSEINIRPFIFCIVKLLGSFGITFLTICGALGLSNFFFLDGFLSIRFRGFGWKDSEKPKLFGIVVYLKSCATYGWSVMGELRIRSLFVPICLFSYLWLLKIYRGIGPIFFFFFCLFMVALGGYIILLFYMSLLSLTDSSFTEEKISLKFHIKLIIIF